MLKTIKGYFSVRRRNNSFLKILAALLLLTIIYLWFRHKATTNNSIPLSRNSEVNVEKLEAALADFVHDEDVQPNSNEETVNQVQDPIQKQAIESENMDEFLAPVLAEYKYVEVDLHEKHSAPQDDYDDEILEDEKRVIPKLGEKGEKAKVPEFQSEVAKEIMKKEAFNRLLSEMISVNRTVPDTREQSCRSLTYDHDLPDASVVIIYTNEAFSSLVRTIHSVINRSPARLLREIILVDDASDKRDLKGKLERYLATRFPVGKVRLVKLIKRAGLIRARMIGAHLSVGKVLVFLDAHCETIDTWLEPLLQRIKEDRKAVVCPIIDVIDDTTLEYYHGNGAFFQIGGFTWSGHFTWINIPPHEASRKEHHHSPTRSPTMAGGLFAIDRKYFWEIGSYDSDMQLWGGENLEMSFRIWQCGGSVEIIPCSRVGHIFRNFHPYSFPGNIDSHGLNTARLVEVWMDEYKELFYSHRGELKHAAFGDVGKRLAFREKANCKSFTWFLDNIHSDKFRLWLGSKFNGQVKNEATNQCLDNMQHNDGDPYILGAYPCYPELYPSQTFYVSNAGELRRETECAKEKDGKGKPEIEMVPCDHMVGLEELWTYENQQLMHESSKKCLTITVENGKGVLSLDPCNSSADNQKWIFDKQKGRTL